MSGEQKKGFFGELSLLTIAATVFASVTSAYVASRLGVSGTLIGAGVASFVSTIAATAYSTGLRRSAELPLLRRETAAGAPGDAGAEEPPEAPQETSSAEPDEPATNPGSFARGLLAAAKENWKAIVAMSVVVLLLTLAIIVGWETATGRGFGTGDGKVVTLFRDDTEPMSTPVPTEDGQSTPTPSTDPEPSVSPTAPPTEQSPSEPAPEPTEPAPEDEPPATE